MGKISGLCDQGVTFLIKQWTGKLSIFNVLAYLET
jgi:hypothetical protein